MRDARRAEPSAANRAMLVSNAAAVINVSGSEGFNPYSIALRRCPSHSAPLTPIATPAKAIHDASRSTMQRTWSARAPRAMRRPIMMMQRREVLGGAHGWRIALVGDGIDQEVAFLLPLAHDLTYTDNLGADVPRQLLSHSPIENFIY